MALGIAGFILSQPDSACADDFVYAAVSNEISINPFVSAPNAITEMGLADIGNLSALSPEDKDKLEGARRQFADSMRNMKRKFTEVKMHCDERNAAITSLLSAPVDEGSHSFDMDFVLKARDKLMSDISELEENIVQTEPVRKEILPNFEKLGNLFHEISSKNPIKGEAGILIKDALEEMGDSLFDTVESGRQSAASQHHLLLTLKSALALMDLDERPHPVSSSKEMGSFLDSVWS